uniref:Uncharacterized protein n=1 Tax=Catharus ustulatus TaxID=91951 RepID=A0A8C3TUA1_CATUS
MPWRWQARMEPTCSCRSGRGRSTPPPPRATAMAARGPPVSPPGCGRGGKERALLPLSQPPPCCLQAARLHQRRNRVAICNNREMPAFTGSCSAQHSGWHF